MNEEQLKFIFGTSDTNEMIKMTKCFVLNNGLRMTPELYEKFEIDFNHGLLIGYKNGCKSEISTISQIETLELKVKSKLSDMDDFINNAGVLG